MIPLSVSTHQRRFRPSVLASLFVPCLLLACRTADEWVDHADREVYEIVREKRALIATGEVEFSIEPPVDPLRDAILEGEAGVDPEEPLVLDLVDCIRIGAENSRTYRSRREDLYLAALDLTLDRWDFDVQPGAGGSASLSGSTSEASSSAFGVFGSLSRLLGSGALVVLDAGLDLSRVLSTGDAFAAFSDATLSVSQPLLRGFGKRIVQEPLTQSERSAVYAARNYERFRRTFAVDVANSYFRILSQRDTLGNELRNRDRLIELRTRSEDLAKAGRRSEIEVDQARQDVLRANDRVIQARQSYQSSLDGFKLFLGLPITSQIELASESGLSIDPDDPILQLREDLAVRTAEDERLDLMTTRDQLVDTERRVYIAKDALRPGLGVNASIGAVSREDKILKAQRGDPDWSLGLNLNLPVNMTPQRNAYRNALISRERQARAVVEAEDRIRLDLRNLRRNLDSALASLRIQEGAVILAERRVEGADLSLQAGRSSTRDLLEAREDLVEAQNQSIFQLTDLTLAGLDYLLAIERLRVDETGIYVERAGLGLEEELELLEEPEVEPPVDSPLDSPLDSATGEGEDAAIDPASRPASEGDEGESETRAAESLLEEDDGDSAAEAGSNEDSPPAEEVGDEDQPLDEEEPALDSDSDSSASDDED